MPLDLPAPPDHPVLPPEVRIAGEKDITLRTSDGERLEALGLLPDSPARVVVLCHPHPLYGGTMHNAVVLAVVKELAKLSGGRVGTLRFNYRGVGQSTGAYGGGEAERDDVRAALAETVARAPDARLGLVGYSFGAGISLHVLEESDQVDRASLIAPALRLFRRQAAGFTQSEGRVQVIAAGRDQFSGLEETIALAGSLGAKLEILSEADHYFIRFRRAVADLVSRFVAPEAYE